jgi:hypothetical protein
LSVEHHRRSDPGLAVDLGKQLPLQEDRAGHVGAPMQVQDDVFSGLAAQPGDPDPADCLLCDGYAGRNLP